MPVSCELCQPVDAEGHFVVVEQTPVVDEVDRDKESGRQTVFQQEWTNHFEALAETNIERQDD